jgi:glycosyltransferase involved in cell wall biosynthesis
MSISRASARALSERVGISANRIWTTGVSLEPMFEADIPVGLPSHILVIGGADPRKNVEAAIAGHASSTLAQKRSVPLVITGNYPQHQVDNFILNAAALGGRRELLLFPGHVDDAALLALYRQAFCVLVPSIAEGFSLPVIEAMAAGSLVFASRIPPHSELLDEDRLFDCLDYDDVARLIDVAIRAPIGGLRGRAADKTRVAEFSAARVGEKFWEPVMAAMTNLEVPSISRNRRPRIAMLSPVPPAKSGVADYTLTTLRELTKLADVDVFTDRASAASIGGVIALRDMREARFSFGAYDRVISVLGNSHFHRDIFQFLMDFGGACIAHDSRMLGFYGAFIERQRTLDLASAELGRRVENRELERWLCDEVVNEVMMFGEIAEVASPLIVHSPITRDCIVHRYNRAASVLPFCLYRDAYTNELPDRSSARSRLPCAETDIVIVSFGYVHYVKGPDECIWSLALLREWGIPAVLHFVGASSSEENTRLLALAQELGVAKHVTIVDQYVSEDLWLDYLIGADVGIQLRTTYFGSISGALSDCISFGLPSVTNASLGLAMEAPSFIRTVPDTLSPVLIAEALSELISSGIDRRQFEEERQQYRASHSMATYAAALCKLLGVDTQRQRPIAREAIARSKSLSSYEFETKIHDDLGRKTATG